MTGIDELMHLGKNDLELFEQKRLELIAAFMDSFSSSPAIKELGQIQKNIDKKMSFHIVNNDPVLFEQKRQEIMTSFFNSFSSGTHKDSLSCIQKTIDNKIGSVE